MEAMTRIRWKTIPLAALALLAVASLAWGSLHAIRKSADLMRRAEEVALFVRGLDPYADPDMTYPPTALPVFTPLVAPFDGRSLRIVWLVGNLVALGFVLKSAVGDRCRSWGRETRLAFCGVVAASKPARLTIGMGQYSLIPLALTLAAVQRAGQGRPWSAGLALAIALAKPTMVLPVLGLFAVRRWWKALLVAAAVQGICLGAVSAWLGVGPEQLIREWVGRASGQQAAGLIDAPSVLARIAPEVAEQGGLVSLVVLVTAFAVLYAGRHRSDLALASVACWFSAVFTYHRPYDLVLLIPPFAWLVEKERTARGLEAVWRRVALGLFAVMLIAPSHPSVVNERLYETCTIALSYGLFATALLDLAGEPRAQA
jgi:hypothetical protein